MPAPPSWSLRRPEPAADLVEIRYRGRLRVAVALVPFKAALARLGQADPRAAKVLTASADLRFLGYPLPTTTPELAKWMKITPGRVSQLRIRAWKKLLALVEGMQPQ